MPRRRLKWRALAVLGALLSVMIDWPIGYAMPAPTAVAAAATIGASQPVVTKTNPFFGGSDLCANCGTMHSFRNLTAASNDRLLTDRDSAGNGDNRDGSANSDGSGKASSDSGGSQNGSSSGKKNSKNDQNTNYPMLASSTTLGSIVKGPIVNSHRSLPPERLMRVYNKRKRKKLNVARVTADLLRSMQTHNTAPSFSSDVNNLIVNRNNHIDSNRANSSHDSSNVSESPSVSVNDDLVNLVSSSSSSRDPLIGDVDITTSSGLVLSDDRITDITATVHYLSRTDRSIHPTHFRHHRKVNDSSNLDRNERSANLSHVSGPARKIQLYIKNRWIQMLPDGTINGTQDDASDYTILQRTTVDVGQIKLQGVATCLFLCMDQCGAVYGSKTFTDECVFNESMEQHHYNTYSSTYNSNSRRTLYLALNRHGEPRKLQIPPSRPLGKLATYTKAMTSTIEDERVEKLIARTFGANRIKHGLRQLCDAGKPLIELTTKVLKSRPKCNLLNSGAVGGQQPAAATAPVNEKLVRLGNHHRSNSNNSTTNSHNSSNNNNNNNNNNPNARKKKKKRKCRLNENEEEHNCHRPGPQALRKRAQKFKCQPEQTPEECSQLRRKQNKNKKGNGGGGNGNAKYKNKKSNNGDMAANRKEKSMQKTTRTTTTTTTEVETTTTSTTSLTTAQIAMAQTLRQQLTTASSHEDEIASTEESQQQQQSSTEIHDELQVDDDDTSLSASLGSHAQLVNGDDLLYDGDFDV